jgi:hypothetical protein
MTIRARRVERRIRLLMAARSLRSLAQGALVVDFALYLRTLGWPAARIGAVMAASLLVGVVLTSVLGPISDRGRGAAEFGAICFSLVLAQCRAREARW